MRISDWSSDVCSSDLIDAFRGFALADPIAPFVVINDRDAKTAWSFTLLHEVAHLWIGATGVSGGHFEGSTEQFCNDVASSFLLPPRELAQLAVTRSTSQGDANQLITAFATERLISRSLVAYRSEEHTSELQSLMRNPYAV